MKFPVLVRRCRSIIVLDSHYGTVPIPHRQCLLQQQQSTPADDFECLSINKVQRSILLKVSIKRIPFIEVVDTTFRVKEIRGCDVGKVLASTPQNTRSCVTWLRATNQSNHRQPLTIMITLWYLFDRRRGRPPPNNHQNHPTPNSHQPQNQ